jgi:hypothetical protein
MTLSGSISTFAEGSERRDSFLTALAATLGIRKWQIVIKSVRAGSVILELEFLRDTNSTVSPLQIVAQLKAASLAGKLEALGVSGLTLGGENAHSGLQPDKGISCLVGSIDSCSAQFSIFNNVQHRWDLCWVCKNTVFKTLTVGGCFNNATARLLSPTCSAAGVSCVSDGRTGSTFSTCATPDCNKCAAAARNSRPGAVAIIGVTLFVMMLSTMW